MNKNLLDIIYLIRDTINTLISIKVKYKVQQLIKSKDENKNTSEKYEELLRQEETEIRKHIAIEHQLKIQIEKLQEKIDNLEKEQNVSINKIIKYL
jgi:uncharacterized protein YlxW (UPF0749 family)